MGLKRNLIILFLLFSFYAVSAAHANPVKILFEEGLKNYTNGKYDAAIKNFEKILEIYPEFPPAYNYLGMVHRDKGTSEDEILYLFKTAVDMNPNYAEAQENLSKTYYGMREFDLAIEHGEKAVKIDPNLLSARLSLAWIYLLGEQDADGAIEHFKYVLKTHDIPYARFGLGLAYFMNDLRPETIDVITQLKARDQNDFAESLESMLRTGYFDPNNSFVTPLLAPPRREKKVTVGDIQNMSGSEMRVRLRGTTEPTKSELRGRSEDSYFKVPKEEISGEERIKALQNNKINSAY